jgi:hypothetical protein
LDARAKSRCLFRFLAAFGRCHSRDLAGLKGLRQSACDTSNGDEGSVDPAVRQVLNDCQQGPRWLVRAPKSLFRGKSLLPSKGRVNAWSMWATAMGCTTPQGTGPTFGHYYFALEAAVGGLDIAFAPWQWVADDMRAPTS